MIVDNVCTLENPLTGAICKAKSTIKAQGKEWSKVAAILGTSHKGAFLEDTVVFYRKDLDKSLLFTTETFGASPSASLRARSTPS